MLRSMIYRLHFETGKVIGTDMNDVTIPYALRKTLCTTSSVSERGDMEPENHSVVIRSIGLHYVKSTVSTVITLMGI